MSKMQDGIHLTWSELPYGTREIKQGAALRYTKAMAETLLCGELLHCCVLDCDELLSRRKRGKKSTFCSKHGVSISTKPTYIYENPARNFIVAKELLKRISKVETWRLGFETSEDALSWNVFVGLYGLGGLAEVFEKLTGIPPKQEPELYLWGNRIDAPGGRFEELDDVRRVLEPGEGIPTEPDIILRVPGQAVVLIEAKFGSSNPRLVAKKSRFGSVTEFSSRYRCKPDVADPLNRKWIADAKDGEVLQQLCRNVIFAHWLASEGEQPIVINLVRLKATNDGQLFRRHLSGHGLQFHVRYWEDLYSLPVIQGEKASVLRSYLKNKTLNLEPAFDF
jgi:hypothetical protein